MKTFCTAAVALGLLAPASAHAADQKMISEIEKLAPRDQLEQRCDTEGMAKVSGDKVIAYTFADPKYGQTHLDAPGAVFRRDGEWYRLAFHCSTTPDHASITAFDYKVGTRIPHSDWDRYYLYD
jgi:hypothetical protein